MKVKKNTWIIISILVGIFIAVGSYYCFIKNWKLSLFIIFPLTTIFVLLRNPDLVFIRAFFFLIFVFLTLNKFFFRFTNHSNSHDFQIGSNEIGPFPNIILLSIAGLSLILHFLKINGNLKGTFLEFNNNRVGNISGSNISVYQGNKDNKEAND